MNIVDQCNSEHILLPIYCKTGSASLCQTKPHQHHDAGGALAILTF